MSSDISNSITITKNQVQDEYIQKCLNSKKPVNVYLVNGIKLQGQILAHDAFTLLIKGKTDESEPQLVYKHACSTIQPQ